MEEFGKNLTLSVSCLFLSLLLLIHPFLPLNIPIKVSHTCHGTRQTVHHLFQLPAFDVIYSGEINLYTRVFAFQKEAQELEKEAESIEEEEEEEETKAIVETERAEEKGTDQNEETLEGEGEKEEDSYERKESESQPEPASASIGSFLSSLLLSFSLYTLMS